MQTLRGNHIGAGVVPDDLRVASERGNFVTIHALTGIQNNAV